MAFFPAAPGGQLSMSSCPPAPCLQTAPVPNMEVKPAIPLKRSPEDEVQFVSVQPVKRFRSSRDFSPVRPSEQGHGPSSSTLPQDHQAHEAQTSNTSSDPASGGGPSTTSEPQRETDMLTRGESLPPMEKYVFPPPLGSLDPMRTSHSSPMLSPKQLPQPRMSTQSHHITGPPGTPAATASASALSSTLPPREFHVPWGMAGLYPQPPPMSTALALHRPLLLPPVQPHRIEPPPVVQNSEQPHFERTLSMQRHEGSQTTSSMHQMPEPRPNPHNAELYGEQQRRSVLEPGYDHQRGPSQQTKEPVTRSPRPQAQPAQHAPAQAVSQASARHESQAQSRDPAAPALPSDQPQAHPQTGTTGSPYNNINGMVATVQRPASKPPCLICEQMRQHALFSQANSYPIGPPPHLQQGWHGSGLVQQQQQQQQPQQPPLPQMGAGFAMGSQMPHGFPSKFQVMPVPAGHVPMGYVLPPQGHFQVPIQMQRPVLAPAAAAGTATSEPSPGQQPSSSQFPQYIPSLPQHMHAQYVQAQMLTSQQSAAAARPAAMAGHQQAQASPAHPPSPPPPPATVQAPAEDASKTPSQEQPEAPQKPSPNLIVDIAETSESVFPWDEVAKRHGVTRQKVIETFAAVIQLPLLRCTTDRKRHGRLATNRLREYTKAKKDVEAAKAKATATATATPASAASATMTPSPSPTSANPVSPAPSNQESAVMLPGVMEMASTMAPLGLPSILTNGLGGQWQPR